MRQGYKATCLIAEGNRSRPLAINRSHRNKISGSTNNCLGRLPLANLAAYHLEGCNPTVTLQPHAQTPHCWRTGQSPPCRSPWMQGGAKEAAAHSPECCADEIAALEAELGERQQQVGDQYEAEALPDHGYRESQPELEQVSSTSPVLLGLICAAGATYGLCSWGCNMHEQADVGASIVPQQCLMAVCSKFPMLILAAASHLRRMCLSAVLQVMHHGIFTL